MGWFLAADGGGLGLNLDILETNLINLVIIIGVLIYFGSKFLGKTLATRQAAIAGAIQEAEQRKQEAATALAEQQQKLAQAKEEAQRILAEAEQAATRAREAILAQAEADVERMRASSAQDLTAQETRAMRELQQRIADLALERAAASLPSRLTDDVQRRLVETSIARLGGE